MVAKNGWSLMPTNLELCQKLGVKPSGSDPITLDDLATARNTRMAAHREMIKRRPGIYPRRWLAGRVGVCTDTLDTYNRDIPIGVKHLYLETRLNWSKLSHVPDNIPIDGAFLEDETGKTVSTTTPHRCTPARAGEASDLQTSGCQLLLVWRDTTLI